MQNTIQNTVASDWLLTAQQTSITALYRFSYILHTSACEYWMLVESVACQRCHQHVQ